MKRNWLTIRDVLLEEPKGDWPEAEWLEHRALCVEAGYTTEFIARGMDDDLIVVSTNPQLLTRRGYDVAAILTNEADLRAVLDRLESLKLGSTEDVVLSLMREKAAAKLKGEK